MKEKEIMVDGILTNVIFFSFFNLWYITYITCMHYFNIQEGLIHLNYHINYN
jgi:hypothetical protein